jgi:hypothetical protein
MTINPQKGKNIYFNDYNFYRSEKRVCKFVKDRFFSFLSFYQISFSYDLIMDESSSFH